MLKFIIFYNKSLLPIHLILLILFYSNILTPSIFYALIVSIIIILKNELTLKNQKVLLLNLATSRLILYITTLLLNLSLFTLWRILL